MLAHQTTDSRIQSAIEGTMTLALTGTTPERWDLEDKVLMALYLEWLPLLVARNQSRILRELAVKSPDAHRLYTQAEAVDPFRPGRDADGWPCTRVKASGARVPSRIASRI